jgi:hypothetical protein
MDLTGGAGEYILDSGKEPTRSRKGADMRKKPSEKEEEYFARMEFERKKEVEEEKHRKLREEEKKKLRDLHFVRCPKCWMELIEIDFKGIKVDKCSECQGVWLDAGELEAGAGLERTALDRFFSVFKR